MLPVEKEKARPTLKTVQDLFDGWRKEKKGRDPIPPALWGAAVALTGQHSIHEIARHLRLNHNTLKTRAHNARSVAFVEINPVTVSTECTVEMEKSTGERMRIRGNCDVIELARVFLA
jgi:hypothetical protein